MAPVRKGNKITKRTKPFKRHQSDRCVLGISTISNWKGRELTSNVLLLPDMPVFQRHGESPRVLITEFGA